MEKWKNKKKKIYLQTKMDVGIFRRLSRLFTINTVEFITFRCCWKNQTTTHKPNINWDQTDVDVDVDADPTNK